MKNLVPGSFGLLRCLAVAGIASLLLGGTAAAVAKPTDDLDIVTVSTRPDTVSGGNVLVRINARHRVAINDLIVLLNGQNVSGAFRPEAGGHSLLGLVDSLVDGENSLVANAVDRNNETYRSASLALTNYPITGPIPVGPARGAVLLHDAAVYVAAIDQYTARARRQCCGLTMVSQCFQIG